MDAIGLLVGLQPAGQRKTIGKLHEFKDLH